MREIEAGILRLVLSQAVEFSQSIGLRETRNFSRERFINTNSK
jgi:hypothetical protein